MGGKRIEKEPDIPGDKERQMIFASKRREKRHSQILRPGNVIKMEGN